MMRFESALEADTRQGEIPHFQLVVAGVLVAKLSLETHHPEVVAGDRVDIIADVMADLEIAIGCAGCLVRRIELTELRVFNEHSAALKSHIKAVVASERGRRHGRRCERHRNAELTHRIVPFQMRPVIELPEHIMRGPVAVQARH